MAIEQRSRDRKMKSTNQTSDFGADVTRQDPLARVRCLTILRYEGL